MTILHAQRLTGRNFVVWNAVDSSTTPQAERDKFLAEDYSRALLQFRNAAQAVPNDSEAY